MYEMRTVNPLRRGQGTDSSAVASATPFVIALGTVARWRTTMNIVIAYDGSDFAKAAIDQLPRAGLPHKVNALVVCVADAPLPAPSSLMEIPPSTLSSRVVGTLVRVRAETDQANEEALIVAREGSQRAHGLFPHWSVSPEPVVGAPAEHLLQKANDWQADLIVLGSRGRNALGRLVLGSVSERVASEARCSVRVARHVERRSGPMRVIVGVDGSPGAQAAIRAVAARSWPKGTEARLVAVDDTIRPTGAVSFVPAAAAWISESNEERLARAHAMLEYAASELLDTGMLVDVRTPKGSPQNLVSQEAAAWAADCIFVGARGFARDNQPWRAGSVSGALVTRAPCSVELIRA
jgi:nucleotide-binding universal stress UspA family protein